jgi:hypothetical protein
VASVNLAGSEDILYLRVEAAVRVLVVRRTKQAGMHWHLANAVRMAAIHARYRSRPEAA